MRCSIRLVPSMVVIALLCAALPSYGQSQVWVVDWLSGPGSQFSALQPAVDSAANGDIVLVRDGYYAPFNANGKSLTIAAANQARPSVGAFGGGSRIEGVPSGGQFTLRGLDVFELELRSSAGHVWIEDCGLTGSPALLAQDCADLIVAHSQVTGSSGHYCPSYPGPYCYEPAGVGALVENSSVTWLSSTAQGGRGAFETGLDVMFPAATGAPTDGASGLIFNGGQLQSLRGTFAGGDGGSASGEGGGWWLQVCHVGANGGVGLELQAGLADLRASLLSGGAAGTGELCYSFFPGDPPTTTSDGVPGLPSVVLGSASLLQSSPAAPDLSGNSPVREGQSLNLQLTGDPLQVVLLALGSPAPTLDLGSLGWLHFETLLVLASTQLNQVGQGSQSFPLTQLPSSMQGYTLAVQIGQLSGGNLVLGTALQTLLLDSSY